MMKRFVVLALVGMVGCSGGLRDAGEGEGDDPNATAESADAIHQVEVAFSGCIESVGVGLAPIDYARTLVPADIVLAGEGGPVTPTVVRTAHCDHVDIDGHGNKPADIVQIGLVIVPPGVPGDIDNYTLAYMTSHEKLAKKLGKLGVDAQYVKKLSIDLTTTSAGSTLEVVVPKKGDPSLSLGGAVFPSSAPAGSFHANWWYEGCDGLVQMATVVPAISIGGSDLALDTPVDPDLGALGLGNPPAPDFPILQQFNAFAAASLVAAHVD